MRAMGLAAMAVWAACGRTGFDGRDAVDASAGDAAPVIGFSQLDAQGSHTCAVYEGAAYCWGKNMEGQIGDGSTVNRPVPVKVSLPAGRIDALVAGRGETCALVEGTLRCWGGRYASLPQDVGLTATATAVTLGNNFLCVTADVTQCVGNNSVGELGDGTTMDRTTLTPIAGPVMRALSAGEDHTCGLPAAGGSPLCWGHNDDGYLGTGSFTPDYSPLPVAVTGPVTTLPTSGAWHACALEAGDVWCWGRGGNGELGDGAGERSASPVRVASLSNVTAVDAGGEADEGDATCAIMDGDVWCWGEGLNGRLGSGRADPAFLPVRVQGLPGPAREIALGHSHTCAALVDGDVWCWGKGDSGELGDGSTSGSFVPVRVQRPQ